MIAVLVLDVAVVSVVAVLFTWTTVVLLGLAVGFCQSLGKLSLDALIQNDVREEVRTSMFARSETLLQLSWVIGGLVGIGLFTVDATPRIGLLAIAAVLLAWLAFVLSRARTEPVRRTRVTADQANSEQAPSQGPISES